MGFGMINDYSDANIQLINEKIKDYMIYFTQKDAGFSSKVNEHVLKVEMKEVTYNLAERLKKDLLIQGKDELVLADSAVKLMSKLHQLYSGTIKFESGNNKVIDDSKAQFIKQHFKDKKLLIFY